jgi:glycosyltransferase involved in cell wall biosynthesis
VANAVLALANAQRDAGAEVTIVGHASGRPVYGAQRPVDGVTVSRWQDRMSLRIGGVRLRLIDPSDARALRALAPDVVHVHAEFNPDNWWAPRLWRRPLVLTPHGAFHEVVRRRGPRAKRLYVSAARCALYGRVDAFHGLSPSEVADIQRAIPHCKTYSVPQGPSPGIHGLPTSSAKGVARADGPVRLLFVGRLDVHTKGLDLLLPALAHVVATAPASVRLRIVGPDWKGGRHALEAMVRQLNLADTVEIADVVDRSQLNEVFDDCDAYVQLSRHEGSPLSLNDALVLGKPAIVSDRVGTVSWSRIAALPYVTIVRADARDGAEAVQRLLRTIDDQSLAARSGASEIAEFLSWRNAAEQHLDRYRSLGAARLAVSPSSRTRSASSSEMSPK